MSQLNPSKREIDEKLFVGNYGRRDLCLVKGRGIWVWDDAGNRYLDCATGIAVNAFGHCFTPVTEAIQRQSEKLIHCSNLFLIESQQQLAERLIQNTPLDKVFFCNSGTEAVEGAIKFARKYQMTITGTDCVNIISFLRSFHGRTYGALAATGQPALQENFGPMPAGFVCCPLNDIPALNRQVDINTAAIILEPILMEGGVITPEKAFLNKIREFQKRGVLIIADEIQTGLGRSGYMLCSEQWGFSPDIVVLAKPLGGGLPLGAILVKNKVASAIKLGDHGSTFGGNPVSCAAGVAIIDQLLSPGFLSSVVKTSQSLRNGLDGFVQKYASLGFSNQILGQGYLIGIQFSGDLPLFMKSCREVGLLVLRAGKDILRLLPPLNVTKSECDLIISRLELATKNTNPL